MKIKADSYKFMSEGQKFRILKADVIMWLIILVCGGLSLLLLGKVQNLSILPKNPFLGTTFGAIAFIGAILYCPILILKLLFHWGRTENLTMPEALQKTKTRQIGRNQKP